MKYSRMDLLLKVFVTLVLLPYARCSEAGRRCEVEKEENNTTYTEDTWCDDGCCHDDYDRVTCCDGSTITSGMVLGFVITGSLVVLIFCIYLRLKVVSGSVKRRTAPHAPVSEEDEVTPRAEMPEQDPPPPYWMCVSQPPPPTPMAPPAPPPLVPSEDHAPTESGPSSGVVSSGLSVVRAEDSQSSVHAASTAVECVQGNERISTSCTSSAQQGALSQGVLLQPSALGVASPSMAPVPETSADREGILPDLANLSSQTGAVVVFIPGQLSAADRQCLLHSSENNAHVLTYGSTESGGSDVTPCNLSGRCQSPTLPKDVPETAPSEAEQSSETSCREAVFIDSPVKEILTRLMPGTVVLFEHTNSSNSSPRD